MNHLLYSYSLCIALPLMLFFGLYFFLAKVPGRAIFNNYLRSRRIMGCAILLLAANYAVHFFFEVRFIDVNLAILMNLATYYLCYWLFSSALTTLLDRFYITCRRLAWHLSSGLLFILCACVVLFALPHGFIQNIGRTTLALWLMGYGLFLSFRLLRTYYKAIRLFDNTHSDDYGAYIKWLSIFTYWALVFGVACSLLTFLPNEYIYLWILSSVPFYIYLFCCYQNYLLFYEQVEEAIEGDSSLNTDDAAAPDNAEADTDATVLPPSVTEEIGRSIAQWVEAEGYTQPKLTIQELAELLHTNRTYLSRYINTTYGVTYREWINTLRIDYAKQRLLQHPDEKIALLSEACGFLSPSHFMKTFKEKENCSPAKWKHARL